MVEICEGGCEVGRGFIKGGGLRVITGKLVGVV